MQNSLPKLDLSSLEKAIVSLQETVLAHQKRPEDLFIRDANIQRFEYTYELSYKMLKRYLELSEANAAEVDTFSFPTLIRTASEKGLTKNGWGIWKLFRNARNITSHTYDEDKAHQVCEAIPAFLEEAEFLLLTLKQKIAAL